jgi:hypothetical protein
MSNRLHRLAGAAAFLAAPAFGQTATGSAAPAADPQQTAAPLDDEADEEEIVITGSRPRGAALGDIAPLETLDSRDVRATGATNITELLSALAPQIGSAQGRGSEGPVLLLNGQRISGFRELRDIPTEAISRVEILPEEVALKYGFAPTQKVVNIVLRNRFRSTAVLAGVTDATDGGQTSGRADVTRLMLGTAGRTTLNVHAEGNGMLTEADRDIAQGEGTARSLIGSRRQLRGTATVNRKIFGDVSATANAELEHSTGRSLLGIGDTLLETLGRETRSDSAHAGFALNGTKAKWRWTVTGNGDLSRDTSRSDRDNADFPEQRTRQERASGDLLGTANGSVFKLPAGDASATFRAGASAIHLDARRISLGETRSDSLGRTSGNAAVNLDLPVSRRNRDFSALGNLTFSVDAGVERLSDFGTLTTLGAGANWSPVEPVSLLVSWRREEGAPTLQQLGEPILETSGARIFDFTTGETALITAITGGNPDLQADRRSVFKVGGNWKPLKETDLRLRAEFVSSTIDRPVQSIFAVTPALEAAFPERFTRNPAGELIAADLRPINFDEARRDTLRLGFDFSKPLKSRRPSQSALDQLRAQFGGRRGGAQSGAATSGETGPPPSSEGGGERAGRGGRGFGSGGGGGFFGGNRGRLQFSLTDTITFTDKVTIGPGLPALDYLHGEAAGSAGGTPRHRVEAQAGWSNNGLGARLSANWRSGTRVDSLGLGELRFGSLATFDLRLFANFGDQLEAVMKQPWLRGSSLRFEVSNIFNARPDVRNASGLTPLNYQSDLLDPLGRTVSISFRKLFSPRPAARRAEREREDGRRSR